MNNKKYLNFPLPMLKTLYTDSNKFFDDIFDVAIFLYSKSLEGDELERYNEALEFLRCTQGNHNRGISNAKKILSDLPFKYCFTGIEKEMYFDYYKNAKSDFQIECLGAFLGIKSILGTKPFCKTNKAHILARMFGYNTFKDLPDKLTPLQEKYKTRWHMDKILMELETGWFLKIISNHQRGMYISFDLSLEELALKSETIKEKNRIQQFKDQKKKAIEAAS
jgi:hypothetical protein